MQKTWRLSLVCLTVLALCACNGDGTDLGSSATGGAGSSSIATPTTSTPAPATTTATTTSQPAPNAPPAFSNSPPKAATAGNFYDFTLRATDPDSTKLTFSAQGLPSWLTLNAASGRLSGTPATDDAGQTPDITLTVSDGENRTSLSAFHITVAAVTAPTPPPAATNQAPTISGSPATSVVATQAYNFTPTAADADSGVLTWSILNKPSWANFSSTTGRLSGTPGRTQAGSHTNIVISVSDGSLSAKLPPFTITVSPPPNDAPQISGTPATTVQTGSAYNFQPSASDKNSDPLLFTISNKPGWATFNASTGKLSGTPTTAGLYQNIVISVTDGLNTTSLPSFRITVTAANQAPTISGNPPTSVQAGSNYQFTPTARDADGDTLSYSISNKPSWAVFSIATGQLSGQPTSSQVGKTDRNIVISVSDGQARVSLPAFAITVSAAPIVTAPIVVANPTPNPTTPNPAPSPPQNTSSGSSNTSSGNTSSGNTSSGNTSSGNTSSGNTSSGNTSPGTSQTPATNIPPPPPPTTSGTATVSWLPPTQNTDGTELVDLAGYRVYHGTNPNSLTDVRIISNPGITLFVFDNLASGRHYFAVSAVNAGGTESSLSETHSKSIP